MERGAEGAPLLVPVTGQASMFVVAQDAPSLYLQQRDNHLVKAGRVPTSGDLVVVVCDGRRYVGRHPTTAEGRVLGVVSAVTRLQPSRGAG
jgi:hypothetical protein